MKKNNLLRAAAVVLGAALLVPAGAATAAPISTEIRLPDYRTVLQIGVTKTLIAAELWESVAYWNGISETAPAGLIIEFPGGAPAEFTEVDGGSLYRYAPAVAGTLKAQFVLSYPSGGDVLQTKTGWMIIVATADGSVSGAPAIASAETLTTSPVSRVNHSYYLNSTDPALIDSGRAGSPQSPMYTLRTTIAGTQTAGTAYSVDLTAYPGWSEWDFTGRVWPALPGGADGTTQVAAADNVIETFEGSDNGIVSFSASAVYPDGGYQLSDGSANFYLERTNGEILGAHIGWFWATPALTYGDSSWFFETGDVVSLGANEVFPSISTVFAYEESLEWVIDEFSPGFSLFDGELTYSATTPGIFAQEVRMRAMVARNISNLVTVRLVVSGDPVVYEVGKPAQSIRFETGVGAPAPSPWGVLAFGLLASFSSLAVALIAGSAVARRTQAHARK